MLNVDNDCTCTVCLSNVFEIILFIYLGCPEFDEHIIFVAAFGVISVKEDVLLQFLRSAKKKHHQFLGRQEFRRRGESGSGGWLHRMSLPAGGADDAGSCILV